MLSEHVSGARHRARGCVVLVAEHRYLAQAQPSGLRRALENRGVDVRLIDADRVALEVGDDKWLDGADVVVARGRSWPVLSLLDWAESRGVPTINSCRAISGVRNKASAAVTLARAGLPIPRTFIGPLHALEERCRKSCARLVTKPVFGDNARGVRLIGDPVTAEPERVEEGPGAFRSESSLAQQFVPGDGFDVKLYGIGDDVWAVRKPSPMPWAADLAGRNAERLDLTPGLADLARRCRAAFGLDLFGVDCIVNPEGTFVIEVNDFPNYTQVPAACERLAGFVTHRMEGSRS
ncbi:MAG: RimK family alpha-L-glutamate ligase [Acidimicrobiia bacterium]